ncbi:MAG: DUF4810 domain-containing protein [Bacteroidetes bacterium]|nr:MAG: DUF4810 domain-containing protein [Bacteroidota bacterium]
MITKMTVPIIALIVCFVGCKPDALYYWGDYSETYYAYKKSPNAETLAKHKLALLKIVSESTLRRKAVPPGVYAELGYFAYQEGKMNESNSYFQKEISLYPESSIFLNRINTESTRGASQ